MRTTTIFAQTHTSERTMSPTGLSLVFCGFIQKLWRVPLKWGRQTRVGWGYPMDSLYKLAYGLSIGRGPNDVSWPDDVIMVTSSFFFKMLRLRQFLSELDDTLTPCSPIWSSRIVDTGLMTSLMTSLRIIIVATLGLNISETKPDSGMVTMDSLYNLPMGYRLDVVPMTSRDRMTS